MKILIISDSFSPLRNAPANRFLTLISFWGKNNKITLITKSNKFNINKINKYINKKNIRVLASRGYFCKHNLVHRILNLFIFFFKSILQIVNLKDEEFDVVIASSPSLNVLPLGLMAKKIFSCKFVIEVRDIWSDSLKDLGLINRGILLKSIIKYENFFYLKANLIVCVSNNIKKRVNTKTPKIVITNFVSIDLVRSFKKKTPKKIDSKFLNILYLGNIGLSQKLSIFLNSIKSFKKIQLIIVGDGLNKKEIIQSDLNLKDNTKIYKYTNSLSSISKHYTKADYCLITLQHIKVFKTVIPSKLFEYAFFNKPIIYFGPRNEAYNLIKDYNIGYVASNNKELTKILLKISSYNQKKEFPMCSFKKFNDDFSPSKISNIYLQHLSDLIKR